MVVAVAVGVNHNTSDASGDGESVSKDSGGDIQSSMKAIKAICQPTDYKETCVQSLSSAAGNTTDPKELVRVGFQVAMKHIREALSQSETLKEVEKDPRAKQALLSCQELMDYAIDDLKNSFDKLGAFDISKVDNILADLKVWLTSVNTYQVTCTDGFENTTGDAGERMKKALKTSGELTENALAMVDEISSILNQLQIPALNRRRLFSTKESAESSETPTTAEDDIPAWIPNEHRKLLFTGPLDALKPDLVVAKDGTGNFATILEALESLPKTKENKTIIMYIKEGVYSEIVEISRNLTGSFIMYGDGPTRTKITGSLNFIDGTPTFKTATVSVNAHGFICKDIGIENAAGAEKHQAVALKVVADMVVFFNCQMDGYQDTLYAHSGRHFFRDCTISGTIDYIFGNGESIFQNCKMVIRKPMVNQANIVTAQGRKTEREVSAIVLQGCTISADPSLVPEKNVFKSYLGRPWKEFSRTIIMETDIDDSISPDGWMPWMGDFGLQTCYYAEFNNRGPGAVLTNRVKWPGIKTPLTPEQAQEYTAAPYIQADDWVKPLGIPYVPGLMSGPAAAAALPTPAASTPAASPPEA
uniref:Pectinesterase n=1 Tax=Nelumbo nucifera TaxID=4432 RepID=A0A822Y2F9_NELNU|nr:TPA_asm: hypothetical protein HUJ06_026709 [Nelumbo nucifera]